MTAQGDDPADLTADALTLSLGTDERSYVHKIPTVKRLRAQRFSDQEIEDALAIKLKPQDRQAST